jgi:hypothetical protein
MHPSSGASLLGTAFVCRCAATGAALSRVNATVCCSVPRYLCSDESSELFLKAAAQLASAGVAFDDASIAAKKQAERDKEAARAPPAGAAGGSGIGGASAGSVAVLGGRGGLGVVGKGGGAAAAGGRPGESKVADEDFPDVQL